MTEKSEALRLADYCDGLADEIDHSHFTDDLRSSAAELRRLSEIETLYLAAMRGRHAMSEELLVLTAQRDALLEALGKMVAAYSGQVQNDGGYTVLDSVRPLITDQAAIKAVEGEQK